jgi:hypothetical protein
MNLTQRPIALAVAAAIGLSACSSGDSDLTAPSGSATLTLSLMDAPVDDVTEVNLEIAAIWLKPAGDGPAFELPLESAPLAVDLLAHTSDNAALLVDGAIVEPGEYEWLAMDVNAEIDQVQDSYVVTDTEQWHEIFVPSSRVRLVDGFTIEGNAAVEFLFDWDLRQGLVHPPGLGGYILKPAFRVIDVNEFGALSGSIAVDTVTLTENECNADSEVDDYDEGNVVYIYAGNGIAPDDVDAIEPEPIATVTASLNDASTHYTYRTLLPFGEYTVAFTCQGANDFADTDELGNEDPMLDTVAFFEPAVDVVIGAPDDLDVVVDF